MLTNQNPEQKARDNIDKMLLASGWVIQSAKEINLSAGQGIAIKEYQTDIGPADYVLFVDKKPIGIIEAKKEDEGYRLNAVEEQSGSYANAKLKHLNNNPLRFVYESTGIITQFTDFNDPKPRSREVFGFFKPETLSGWTKQDKTLRKQLSTLKKLNETGLRKAQIRAISNLEQSFKNNHPRALIQMTMGAGKTFTATTFIYRLLKNAGAKRILFLVDTKNLGEQAEQEFQSFQPNDDNRKFTDLYNVQRLSSSYIASDSQVCISTIQRMYSILKGEELAEDADEINPNEIPWIENQNKKNEPLPVVYSPDVPIEQFDFIVIDECHRSIYNLWRQVLDYFDAFLIGLTATPDKRTFGFFNENVVSEYSYEQSVIDGVNVPYEVYHITTDISQQGSEIKQGWKIEKRDKLTRKKRWQQLEEDTNYNPNELDRKVVNPSQIRNIIKAYKQALKTTIFPNRIDKDGDYEVPKTLVFAKTDSHADDIIKVIREEFNEGNDFCKKVTYKATEDPKSILSQFRNSYYPRIAVTVDMIATGTDVKPLEVLLFMRDVRSANYFEQMKGRGTRTIDSDKFQTISQTAQHKTHFVLVDCVGVTQSKKTDSRPLERKPTIVLKELLDAVTIGAKDEDLFLSLANRLIRLNLQITEAEKSQVLTHSNGKNIGQIAKALIDAYDQDSIDDKAKLIIEKLPVLEQTEEKITQIKQQAQDELIDTAASVFNGKLNNYLDNVRRQHEQIIDDINIDSVIKSEWDTTSTDNAKAIIQDFSDYIETHKDEITALSIFYNQPYNRKNITFEMIKTLLDKLLSDKPNLAPSNIWDAYNALEQTKITQPKQQLTALISLIRKLCGIDKNLIAFDKTIESNFNKWVFNQHTGNRNRFNQAQLDWLQLLKQHILTSYHFEKSDLDFTPFDAQGGQAKMYQLFGDEMDAIIDELNEVLVA